MRLSVTFLCVAILLRSAEASGQYGTCDYYQEMTPGQTIEVSSPNSPYSYTGNTKCRWEAITTSNSKLILECKRFSIPQSQDCKDDCFRVSPTGNTDFTDAHKYCGTGTFTIQSSDNKIAMDLIAPYNSNGGSFTCTLTATSPTTSPPPTCDCGWKKESRIVNGQETGVNEYPMMAGLVDFTIRDLFCGSTIVSTRYCITAAHCLLKRLVENTGVLVGDHDIDSGSETNSATILRAQSFTAHPQYNSATQVNDIAIIRTTDDIVFSLEVGPACLPFRFSTTSDGTVVQLLGWGTTEQAGPKSNVLLKTSLDVVDINDCIKSFGSKVSDNQICTFKNGTDACQADSGGPVLWSGPGDRQQLVGVISYGKGCATKYPGVNTRIYPYIDWILSVTPDAQYCVR